MEEHRVEHLARGRIQPEGDIREPERCLHSRVQGLELPDRLDGLDAVAPRLFLAGRDREGERVDEDVLNLHAVVGGEVLDEPVGDPNLPFGSARLALLIDGERDDRGSMLLNERHDAREA